MTVVDFPAPVADIKFDTQATSLAPARWRNLLRTRAVLVVLFIELLAAFMVSYGIWILRRQTLDSELHTLSTLSAAMAAQAESTLALADTVLRATRTELNDGLLSPTSAAAHTLLRTRAAALPQFRALAILDAQGMRLATSRDSAPPVISLADRDFFVEARRLAGTTLFVGSPSPSRSDGQASIGVALDWQSQSGQFGGVVVLAAEPEFLDGDFAHIAPSPDTRMAIYRSDHELVSDGPGDNLKHLLPPAIMDRLWDSAAPRIPRLIELPDGQQRLVATQKLHRFPLMVLITRDLSEVLADWTQQAWLIGSFSASALLVTFLLTLRNAREQLLRRASQAELAAERERAVRAFQAAQEGYWEWDPAQRKSHLSPRMRELIGLDRDEPKQDQHGLLASDHIHSADIEHLRLAFQTHEEGRSSYFDVTFRVQQSDGLWHHVRTRGQAWRNPQGDPVLFTGTGTDVTAEVQAQDQTHQLEGQLHRARKLEALGTLAGGIAHDFNNILASVIGYGELARDAAAPGSDHARWLEQIMRGGQRGKALVNRILSFSHSGARRHIAFRLEPVIQEMLDLLLASLPANVRLDRKIDGAGAVVSGDSTMVYEAAMNLCTNAIQAMPQGGTLGVELQLVKLTQSLPLSEKTLVAGQYARLTVSDTGSGIDPEVMARLFEPFFTTRGPHRGTGLGLAVVHSVMTDMGGSIDVQSEPDQGSRFALFFPCVDAAVAQAQAVTQEVALGSGQTVMVVDDDQTLVELTEELLAGLGYEAVGMCSSVQALAEFTAQPDRFDLVITDEIMPEMTGTALAASLHALRPNLPLVLISGYGGPQLQERAGAAGVSVRLRKPLLRSELAQALEQALLSGTAAAKF